MANNTEKPTPPAMPTANAPHQLAKDVLIFKKATRFHIKYLHEEYILQVDQKVLRKFMDLVKTVQEFFDAEPEFAIKFFKVYQIYLKTDGQHDEKMLKSVVAIMFEGFELMEKFLETHDNITSLKLPTGKEYKKDQLIDIDRIKHLVIYSWKLKLYTFYKFLVNIKINKKVDEMIMDRIITKHLKEPELSEVILNIVKGKVIATISSRSEMWKYLEYSIRKSPELYISQLYNYTVIYILLYMKDARNPIGYLGNFIDRQILYIFSDVYVVEVVYHDIDDQHIKYKGLEVQAVTNHITSMFLETINNFYSPSVVNKFLSSYKTNTNIVNILVYPIISKLLFKHDNNINLNYNYNVGIFTLYAAIMYSSSLFKFKYIPKLLTSNTVNSKKVNFRKQVRETIMINTLYEIPLRNIDVLKDNQIFNNVFNAMNNIYRNLLTNQVFEFNIYEFINEFKQLLLILSNDSALDEIRETLEFNNYMFKRSTPIDNIGKKVINDGNK